MFNTFSFNWFHCIAEIVLRGETVLCLAHRFPLRRVHWGQKVTEGYSQMHSLLLSQFFSAYFVTFLNLDFVNFLDTGIWVFKICLSYSFVPFLMFDSLASCVCVCAVKFDGFGMTAGGGGAHIRWVGLAPKIAFLVLKFMWGPSLLHNANDVREVLSPQFGFRCSSSVFELFLSPQVADWKKSV